MWIFITYLNIAKQFIKHTFSDQAYAWNGNQTVHRLDPPPPLYYKHIK